MTADHRDLASLGTDELLEAWVEALQAQHAAEHIGRKNRFARKCSTILDLLTARAEGTARVMQALLAHQDPQVRLSAAVFYKAVDRAAYLSIVATLAQRNGKVGREAQWLLRSENEDKAAREAQLRPSVQEFLEQAASLPPMPPESRFWQTSRPPPMGLAPHDLLRRLRASVASGSSQERFLDLARPAIGIWPQRLQAGTAPTASRLGGLPCVPRDWSWPVCASEPLFFLGHVNCRDLAELPTAAALPRQGLLAFFGDHDWVNGCFPGWDPQAAVYYWPETETLVPATVPIEDFTIFPDCALRFFETLDLPHPLSTPVARLNLNDHDAGRYREIFRGLSATSHDVAENRFQMRISKMFGWPDLIQGELEIAEDEDHDEWQLLLQLGSYENGVDVQSWGPGGVLYFTIPTADLAAGRFDRVDSEMQCT